MEMIEIEAFIAVASEGSFTRAADVLHVSQPAVSRRIELLEQELGMSLFDRLPTGSRLTNAGEAFLPFARHIMAGVRDGTVAVRTLATGEEGTIALAIVGTLASTVLTKRLREFRTAYPGIRVTLRTALSDEVSALVQQGDVELGLRYFPDPSNAVISVVVEEEALVVVCAEHSRLVNPSGTDVTALHGVPWVSFAVETGTSGEAFARAVRRQLLHAGLDDAEMIIIDSLTAQKRFIEADFGLGLLPASSIEEELRLGTLRTLPVADLMTTIPVCAIYRRAGYLSPAARRLLTELTTQDSVNRRP